jgi:hypothetical protein
MAYKNNPYTIALTIVLTALISGGGVYFWQNNDREDNEKNLKEYTDTTTGVSFKYPSEWSIGSEKNNPESEKKPKLFVDSLDINKMSTVCGELGGCQQDAKKLQQDIEKGIAPGIISFNGGKGSLVINCSGNEGYDLVPSPMYEFTFFKGDKSYLVRLNDLSHRLKGKETCVQSSYLKKIQSPSETKGDDYQPYNDFLSMIKNTLVIK